MTNRPTLEAKGADVIDWLSRYTRLLVLTHARPDGDALGGAFGAACLLRDMGKEATVWVDEPLPFAYTWMAPESLVVVEDVDMSSFDAVLCLDCAKSDRLAIPNGMAFEDITLPTCNMDHHLDNPEYGCVTLIERQASATCELLAQFAEQQNLTMAADTATRLMIGIVTDTGGYRHSNTDATTHRVTAWLFEQGADHHMVVKSSFHSESLGMLRLKARILQEFRTELDNRLAWFVVTQDLLDECGVEARDTEDLVDVVRPMYGLEILCRLQLVSDGVRFSFRSLNPEIPIIGIAQQLGGGGHAMAAGAHVKGITIADAEQLLITHAKETLCG